MKNQKLLLTLTVLLYCVKLLSQESIVFDKQYLFDERNNYIKGLKQTSDGGFICGGSIGFEMYDVRFLLFKTDSLGEVEFYKYQDSVSVNSDLRAVDITKTGNFVGFGKTQENPDWHSSGAIVMYNSEGDTLWTKQYAFQHPSIVGLYSMISFYDGIYTSDNSLVAAGSIKDDNLGDSDPNPIVVKTNIVGDTLWTWRLYNTDNTIVIESIAETHEGDYVAVGRADMPILSEDKTYAPQRGFIVKLSPEGELVYLKEWTDIEFNYFTDLAINNNGELVISGVCFRHPPGYPDDSYHSLLVKTDALGETILYEEIFYGKNCGGVGVITDNADDICLLIMFGAAADSNGVWGFEVLLQKYYNDGNLGWEKSIGGVYITNRPYAIASTKDNGFAFCGLYSTATQNFSWLVKVDSLGNGDYSEGWINDISSNYYDQEIHIYPNPANQNIHVQFLNEQNRFNISIFSLDGREIKRLENQSNSIFVGDLANGLYIIKINYDNRTYTKKIIVKR